MSWTERGSNEAMIQQWHPSKLGVIWLVDLALFRVLWLMASPHRGDDKALVIVVWLVLSIPAFIVTWKWASGRERRFVFGSAPNTDERLSAPSTRVEATLLSVPFLHEASPELARTLVLQSLKDRKVLRIKCIDGTEMDVAVRYEMHPFHWEHFGPCFMAIRYPKEKGKKWAWEQIKYSDIAALAIRDMKYDLRLRLEDHYKRIAESKLCKQLGLMAAGTLLIAFCSSFAAMLLAILVSNHLQLASYMTAFWWIAGSIAAVFFLWMLRPGGILLEPDAPMEGEARAFIGSLFFGGILGSGYLFVFGLFVFRDTIQTLGWTVVLMMALAAYLSIPQNVRDRFLAAWGKTFSTGLEKMSILLLAGVLIFFFGHYLNYLGERYNHVLRTMVNLPVKDNSSD